ncbi:MAG: radical SAM protein [Alphaproteobacteria bacterium]|nr:radical SAM protein [Alphaproteobacteria bacterium]
MDQNRLLMDGTKIQYHLEALAKWKRGETVYPILVEISPTNGCNHGCTFCAYDYINRDNTFLDADRLMAVLDELRELGTKSLFYSGEGEPLLHKQLTEIIGHAAGLGFSQGLNTNGTALLGETMTSIVPHMSFIRCSINGATAEEYAETHRTKPKQFDDVLRNLEAAVAFREREGLETTIGVQMVYLGQKVEDIVAMGRRIKSLGLNYFSVKQFNEHPRNPFKTDFDRLTDDNIGPITALSDDGFLATVRTGLQSGLEKRTYKRCLALPFFAEIVANGEVYACGPHLGEPDYCYGSIHDMTFTQMWDPANRAKVTNYIDGVDDLDCECMPNCRLDALNRFLWELENPPAHVNFI